MALNAPFDALSNFQLGEDREEARGGPALLVGAVDFASWSPFDGTVLLVTEDSLTTWLVIVPWARARSTGSP